MWGYFKPLRRKLGVVTLGLACLFGAAWVRSLFAADVVEVRTGPHSLEALKSGIHLLAWESMFCDLDSSTRVFNWNTYPSPELFDTTFKWNDRYYGFDVYQLGGPSENFVFTRRSIPYWSVVVPITLLSAGLLLSKPRVRQPKPTLESSSC